MAVQRDVPELVIMQPSAAGAYQVQQAILNLVLTAMEQVFKGPARMPTSTSKIKLCVLFTFVMYSD